MRSRLIALWLVVVMVVSMLPVSVLSDGAVNSVLSASVAGAAGETAESSSSASVKPKKIAIEGSKYVAKGKKITLTATVSPEKASQKVIWTSSNKKIATVTSKGVVKGIKAGKVKITATSKSNPKIKKTFTVKVMAKAVKKVKISNAVSELDLTGTKTVTLKAKATPSKAAQSFEWKSSNTSIATVNEKGKVTAKGVGTVKITATATDGSKKKATVKITVMDSSSVETATPEPTETPTLTPLPTETPTVTPTMEPAISGKISETIFWKLEDGVLTISGNGSIPNYDVEGQPWKELRDQITNIVIGEEITAIGENSFSGTIASEISISSTVTTIEDGAFADSVNLKKIDIPATVISINGDPFRGCGQLSEIQGEMGSAASEYASAHGINFVTTSMPTDEPTAEPTEPGPLQAEFMEPPTRAVGGGEMIWEVSVEGGNPVYQYQYIVYRNDQIYYTGDDNGIGYFTVDTIKPEKGSKDYYYCEITVEDSLGESVKIVSPIVTVDSPADALQVNLSADQAEIMEGETASWKASAMGGSGKYEYEFTVTSNEEIIYTSEKITADSLDIPLYSSGRALTEYQCQVVVYDRDGLEAVSNISTITVKRDVSPIVLEAPTGFNARSLLPNGEIYVSWDEVEDATQYLLFYEVLEGVDPSKEWIDAEKTSFTFTPILADAGSEVKVWLCALDGTTGGQETDVLTVRIRKITGGFAQKSITEEIGNEVRFDINVSSAGCSIKEVELVDSNGAVICSETDDYGTSVSTTLKADDGNTLFNTAGTYNVSLRVKTENDERVIVDTIQVIMNEHEEKFLEAPQLISAEYNESTKKVTATWNTVDGATSYTLHASEAYNMTVKRYSENYTTGTGTIGGLPAGIYYIAVSADDGDVWSTYSNRIQVTVPEEEEKCTLDLDPSKWNPTCMPSTKKIYVDYDGYYTASINSAARSWLSCEQIDDMIILTVTKNTTGSTRTGTLTVTCGEHGESTSIKIKQTSGEDLERPVITTCEVQAATLVVKWNRISNLEYELQSTSTPNVEKSWKKVNVAGSEYAIAYSPSGRYYFRVRAIKDDSYSDWSEVRFVDVEDYVASTSVSITNSGKVYVGDEVKLKATVKPSNASVKSFYWSIVSGSSYASIQDGVLYALGAGSVTIKVETVDGENNSDTLTVTIRQPESNVDLVSNIEITPEISTIAVNELLTFTATVTPRYADNKKVKWEVSSGTGKAYINSNGTLVGQQSGTVYVTARSTDGSDVVSNEATVTIENAKQLVEGITVSGASTVDTGSTITLGAKVVPSDADNQEIEWSISSGESYASISSDGILTGIAEGTVKVRATAVDGSGVYGEKTIKVQKAAENTKKVASITVNGSTTYIASEQKLADVVEFTAEVAPDDATNPSVIWSASSDAVNIGDRKDGSIYITSNHVDEPTEVTITATAKDGSGVSGSAMIMVYDRPVIKIKSTKIPLNTTYRTFDLANNEDLVFTLNAGNVTEGYDYNVILMDEAPDFANNTGISLNDRVTVNWSEGTISIPASELKDKEGSYIKIGAKPANYPTGWAVTAVKLTKTAAEVIDISSVNISEQTLSITEGSNKLLGITHSPSNASISSYEWTSSNPEVATVSVGVSILQVYKNIATVHAVSEGTATITATVTSTAGTVKTITCDVTVEALEKATEAPIPTIEMDGSTAIISWNSVNDATYYQIYRGTTSDKSKAVLYYNDIAADTLKTYVTGLASGKTYWFWVVSGNSGGTAWSEAVSGTVTETAANVSVSGSFSTNEGTTSTVTLNAGDEKITVVATGRVTNGTISRMSVLGRIYGTTTSITGFESPSRDYHGTTNQTQELSFVIDPSKAPFNTPGDYQLRFFVKTKENEDTALKEAAFLRVIIKEKKADPPKLSLKKSETSISARNDQTEDLYVWFNTDATYATLEMLNSRGENMPIYVYWMDKETTNLDDCACEIKSGVGGLRFRVSKGIPTGMYTMRVTATNDAGGVKQITYPFSVRRTEHEYKLDANASLAEKFAALEKMMPTGTYFNFAGNTYDIKISNGYGRNFLVTLSDTSCESGHYSMVHTDKNDNAYFTCENVDGYSQCKGWVRLIAWIIGGRALSASGAKQHGVEALDTIEPGDIIRYKNDGHSILVTSVSGDTITYTDCNGSSNVIHCDIRWGQPITKSQIKNNGFSYIYKYSEYKVEDSGEWTVYHDSEPSEWLKGRFEYLEKMLPTGAGWHEWSGVETYGNKTITHTQTEVKLTGGVVDYTTTISNHPHIRYHNGECGGFYKDEVRLSGQCMGFTDMLGYYLHGGERPYSNKDWNRKDNPKGNTLSKYLDQLKPGDIVCYIDSSTDQTWGHKIMITKVENDILYYVHANGDSSCGISWNDQISRNDLKKKTSFPYICFYPGDPENVQ